MLYQLMSLHPNVMTKIANDTWCVIIDLMTTTKSTGISIAIVIAIGFAIYFATVKTSPITDNNSNISTTTTSSNTASSTAYANTEYSFTFSLPKSWEGYTVIEDEWEGYSLTADGNDQIITEHGPLISIRHPDWEYKAPRQDIPIMVFTLKQWSDMISDKFHIGAAPVNPSEIARNKKYVFAIPARYNFSYLTGYEEVDKIIQSKPIKTF